MLINVLQLNAVCLNVGILHWKMSICEKRIKMRNFDDTSRKLKKKHRELNVDIEDISSEKMCIN